MRGKRAPPKGDGILGGVSAPPTDGDLSFWGAFREAGSFGPGLPFPSPGKEGSLQVHEAAPRYVLKETALCCLAFHPNLY